jgi:hypothetical protein
VTTEDVRGVVIIRLKGWDFGPRHYSMIEDRISSGTASVAYNPHFTLQPKLSQHSINSMYSYIFNHISQLTCRNTTSSIEQSPLLSSLLSDFLDMVWIFRRQEIFRNIEVCIHKYEVALYVYIKVKRRTTEREWYVSE